MINRKVLYGYQIQNGALEIAPEEQRAVSMVFTLYNAGASYPWLGTVPMQPSGFSNRLTPRSI